MRRKRLGNIPRDNIDTRNIQTDNPRGESRLGGDTRMDLSQHINTNLGVARQHHYLVYGRHGVKRQILTGQGQAHGWKIIKIFDGQRHHRRLSSIGQPVQSRVEQVVQTVAAVASYTERFGAGCSHHLVTHHQQAVFFAFDIFFDDYG